MTSALRRTLLGATLVALAAMATPAQAAPTLFYKINGGATSAGAATILAAGTSGVIDWQIASSATQSATVSTLNSTTLTLNNTSSTAGSITIDITGTGYTLPSPTLTLSSSAQGTSSITTAGQTATLQSYADGGNGQFGTSVTSGPQVGTTASSAPPSTTYTFDLPVRNTAFAVSSTYSISQRFVINLAGGQNAQLTLATSVNAGTPPAVPEPSTIAMALVALPFLGVVGHRRLRRKDD